MRVTPKDFKPYIGKFGLLSQQDLDQGDASQRIGTYFTLASILKWHESYRETPIAQSFVNDLELLSSPTFGPGWYRRTPDHTYWGSDPKRFSADQKSILMLGMAAMGFKSYIKEAALVQLKRFGFHQNTRDGITGKFKFPDITRPAEISALIRGTETKWLYWLLPIIDLGFHIDLLLRHRQVWDYDNMVSQQLFYAVSKSPTKVALSAFKKYQKTNFADTLYKYHCTLNGIRPLYDMFLEANELLCRRFNYEACNPTYRTSQPPVS